MLSWSELPCTLLHVGEQCTVTAWSPCCGSVGSPPTHLQCSDLCDHLFLLNWQHLDRHNWVDTVICVCGDLRAWLVAAGSESGAGHASRGKQPGHSILRWFYMPVGHFALFTCRWQKGQRISIICATVGVKTGHILWPYSHTVLPFPRTPNTSLIIHM